MCPYQTLNYTLYIEGEINGNYQTAAMSDQLKIQDSPGEIHINTHPNLSFSLQEHYTVYVTLITSGSEGVITESTNFSKLFTELRVNPRIIILHCCADTGTIVNFPNCSTSVNGIYACM